MSRNGDRIERIRSTLLAGRPLSEQSFTGLLGLRSMARQHGGKPTEAEVEAEMATRRAQRREG
jgi:hypothetical protein